MRISSYEPWWLRRLDRYRSCLHMSKKINHPNFARFRSLRHRVYAHEAKKAVSELFNQIISDTHLDKAKSVRKDEKGKQTERKREGERRSYTEYRSARVHAPKGTLSSTLKRYQGSLSPSFSPSRALSFSFALSLLSAKSRAALLSQRV